MNIRYSLPLAVFFILQHLAFGQGLSPHVPGQVLASLAPGRSQEALERRFKETHGRGPVLLSSKKISDLLNTWRFETEHDERSEALLLAWLQHQPEVRNAQYNHLLAPRDPAPGPEDYRKIYGANTSAQLLNTPNDPLYNAQWQYLNTGSNGGVANADLDADLAWDITTGGLTPAGDTIVVAVIDGGIEAEHPDLAPNLWHNRHEIPNDSVDNDGNGYVDDFRGWNVYQENDDIAGNSTGHGTSVSGIVGARGDNGVGVAGVNWRVKMMFVAGSSNEAAILAAYDYVLKSRKLYNASGGEKGAFVVAVNCSWGVNYGQPSEAPLWCAAFDSLGAAGILAAAATANLPINVDEAGDLPTACPSNFLIAVTSLNNADQKAPNAAWGAASVDLGAYGAGIFTTKTNGEYGTESGTSYAAPQVAGAIALAYAAPCSNLISLAKAKPALAALWVKKLMLEAATPNASLEGKTKTNGRLNIADLLENYKGQCSACPSPFALLARAVGTHSVLLDWTEIAEFQAIDLRWRKSGALGWNLALGVDPPYGLDDLDVCTEYEFSVRAACAGPTQSEWTEPLTFTTDGCCAPPAILILHEVSETWARLRWPAVTAATHYRLRLRPVGGDTWKNLMTADTTIVFPNLLPCTEYEAQIQTMCDTGLAPLATALIFQTAGCGSCLDSAYCSGKSESAAAEWISLIDIGAWTHASVAGDGFENFTGDLMLNTLHLYPESQELTVITPGFSGLSYKEYFRIYVDFNLDGDFDDPGELAFDPGFASDVAIIGQLTTPFFDNTGLTRMRVMMKYQDLLDLPPQPCETFGFGQVEDYCIRLSEGALSAHSGIDGREKMKIWPNPARDRLSVSFPEALSGNTVRLSLHDMMGRQVLSQETALDSQAGALIDVTGLPSGFYRLAAVGSGRAFSEKITVSGKP